MRRSTRPAKRHPRGACPIWPRSRTRTPSAANIRRYAEIVRERCILRRLVTVGDEIAASALTPAGQDAKDLLDKAEAKIFEIAEAGARASTGFVPIQPVLGQVVDRIQELYARDDQSEVTGVPYGLIDLDEMTSGLQGSDMVVIAGRPRHGQDDFRPERCRKRRAECASSGCGVLDGNAGNPACDALHRVRWGGWISTACARAS